MVLDQIVAFVMVNKHVKFDKICFNTYKVIAEVKVCHNDNDDDNDDDNDYAAANTRVMTIHWLFFFEKTAELKMMQTLIRGTFSIYKVVDEGWYKFFRSLTVTESRGTVFAGGRSQKVKRFPRDSVDIHDLKNLYYLYSYMNPHKNSHFANYLF